MAMPGRPNLITGPRCLAMYAAQQGAAADPLQLLPIPVHCGVCITPTELGSRAGGQLNARSVRRREGVPAAFAGS